MKNLFKSVSVSENFAGFVFNNSEQVAVSEKLGGQAEWAKEQLRGKTKTALDTLGDLTKLEFLSKENIISLLNTSEAQKNWTRKEGGKPKNSARYVMALQGGLTLLDFKSEVDAMYGTETKNAVISFQKKYKLKVDGLPGPETIGKILELLNKKSEKKKQEQKPAKNEFGPQLPKNNSGKKFYPPFIEPQPELSENNEVTNKLTAEDIFNSIDEKFDFDGVWGNDTESKRDFSEKVFAICKNANVIIPNKKTINKFLESVSDNKGNVNYGESLFSLDKTDNADNKKILNKFKEFYIKNATVEKPAKKEKIKEGKENVEKGKKDSNKDENSRDLPKTGDEKITKLEGEIDWSKSPEFENENSREFMQALLDNREKLQKELGIPDDLYKDLMALSFADLQLEGSGGKNRKNVLIEKYILDPLDVNSSKGWTQINVLAQGKETREILKKFGITENTDLWNPKKSAIATMIVKAQQYKWDIRRYKKKNPKLSNLELMEYIYYNNLELKNGTATPEKNGRIKLAKKYFKIGKEILGHDKPSFTEKIIRRNSKNKEKLRSEIDWSRYKGKNFWRPNNSKWPKDGCATFPITVYGRQEKNAKKNIIDGNAWETSNNIVYDGGIEVYNAFKGVKLDETKWTSYVNNLTLKNYIGELVKNKEVNPAKLKVGDVVNIYYPWSDNYSKAYPVALEYQKTGKIAMPVTHVGIVTEKDGNLYITHNVHGTIRSHPIMDLVKGKWTEKNDKSMKIVGVYRPNTKELRKYTKLESSKIKPKKSPLEES